MKKISLIIIIFICVFVLVGCFENEPKPSDIYNVNGKNEINSVSDSGEIVNNDIKNANLFRGLSINDWEKKIKDYYGEHANEIICKFDESGDFTADVASEFEVFAEFVFNKDSGIAKEKHSGLEIDFINQKVVNTLKDLSNYFTDNISLGIANYTDETEEKIVNAYFNNYASYQSLTRYNLSNNTEYSAKFLIIPKDDSVKFDIYSCIISDDGNVVPDVEIDKDINEPILFYFDDYESITPQYCIILKVNGSEDIIPIVFSGMDGSLNIVGHEAEVIDLSLED